VPPATVVKGLDKAEDFAPSAPMGSKVAAVNTLDFERIKNASIAALS
jgi:hypothetical protein